VQRHDPEPPEQETDAADGEIVDFLAEQERQPEDVTGERPRRAAIDRAVEDGIVEERDRLGGELRFVLLELVGKR